MIAASVILGFSLIAAAAILFAGLVNQRTQVVYMSASTEELLVELTRRTTKVVKNLTDEVKNAAESVTSDSPNQQQAAVG